jgi:predicted phosphodiesterase
LRVAIFSDMHGNCVALDAVIEDFARREIDKSVCLGDALQGGSQPKEILKRLDDLGCPVVLGNSDDFLLTGAAEGEQVSDAHLQVRDWTREQIGEEGLERVRGFVPTHELDLGAGRKLLCFHGGPRSHSHVMLPKSTDEEVEEVLGGQDAGWLTGGHTHVQWMRRLDGGRTFFNPGSAGVAYNRNMEREEFYFYPIAQYAVVSTTDNTITIEFCQVPFDVDLLEESARKSGRPFSENEARQYRPR